MRREAPIADSAAGGGRWALDHLFLDQDGVPTLVEVKRSSDTRLRREVVGQMLDYATNAVAYWPVEKLATEFEATCERSGIDPDEAVSRLTEDVVAPEEFWQTMKTNLQAGRVRMVFVADVMPPELRRVVEFLNSPVQPARRAAMAWFRQAGSSVISATT